MKKYAILLGTILLGLASALSYAQAPVPFINLPLVPDATPPGGPEFTLTVNGTGFVSNSVVNWNGVPLATQFVSGSQLTATVPAANIATATGASVSVFSPAPGGGTSATVPFEITTPVSSPAFDISDYGAPFGPDSVVAADFNADGNLDMAGVNLANSIQVYLGNGTGGFTYNGAYATGPNNDSLTVGDFNGDGIPDLAVRGGAVLLGNGDGSFQAPIDYPVVCDSAIAVGDFNGDGKLDVACTDSSNVVYILLGNGDGTFQNHATYATGSSPYGVAVGDFNRDGKLDLVIVLGGANAVAIYLGNGDGTFQPPVQYAIAGVSGEVYAADLNGDGLLDLVAPVQSSPEISVLLGNGDGTFRPHVDYLVPTDVFRGGLADVNGDGKLDFVATNWIAGSQAFILLGNGDGTFGSATAFTVGACPLGVAFGDFNKDGLLDIVVGDQCGGPFVVMLGTSPAPAVTLSPTSLSFGIQPVDTVSNPQAVTLTNSGSAPLDITSIVASANFAKSSTCGRSLIAGAFCTIAVTFRPQSIGTLTGAISITDNAPNSPQTVSLSGIGTAVALSPSSVDFGDQPVGTTSPPQTVTLTNNSKGLLSIQGIRIAGGAAGSFAQSNTCVNNIPTGGDCTISVTFTPKSTGAKNGTLEVYDNGGASPQTVALSGNGT